MLNVRLFSKKAVWSLFIRDLSIWLSLSHSNTLTMQVIEVGWCLLHVSEINLNLD